MNKTQISNTWAWSMFFIAACFYGYEYLLRVAPSVMVPYLMDLFKINAQNVGILSAFYYYTYTPLQLFAGTMIDHYGARLILTISVVTCVIGTYFFGMTESLLLAKLGRALIGFGSAFAFVGAMKVCSDWLPENLFATLAGITTTIGMVGAISGEVMLSDLKNSVGVPNTFLFCIIFGIVLSILTWFFIRTKTFITAKSGSAEIKYLFQHMLFMVKKPIFWNISIIGLCLFMPTTIFGSLWAVKFLDDVYKIDNAAHCGSMIFVGWAVGGPLVGIIKKNIFSQDKYILAFGAIMAFLTSVLIIYFPKLSHEHIYLLMFSFGFFSSVEILVFDLNHILSGPALCGTAVALTNMVIMLGGFAQPVVGYILDKHHAGNLGGHTFCDYKVALAIIPLSFIIGFILSIFFPEKQVVPCDGIPE